METIKKGCVYFFKHNGLSPVKIGYSKNETPESRFNDFSTYAPNGGKILGYATHEYPKRLEDKLHRIFDAYRLQGEWFNISFKDIKKELIKIVDKQDIYLEFNKKKKDDINSLNIKELFEFLDSFLNADYAPAANLKAIYNLTRNQASKEVKSTTVMNKVVEKYCNAKNVYLDKRTIKKTVNIKLIRL